MWPCWENSGHFGPVAFNVILFVSFRLLRFSPDCNSLGAVCINKAPGSFTSAETKATHVLVADHDK